MSFDKLAINSGSPLIPVSTEEKEQISPTTENKNFQNQEKVSDSAQNIFSSSEENVTNSIHNNSQIIWEEKERDTANEQTDLNLSPRLRRKNLSNSEASSLTSSDQVANEDANLNALLSLSQIFFRNKIQQQMSLPEPRMSFPAKRNGEVLSSPTKRQKVTIDTPITWRKIQLLDPETTAFFIPSYKNAEEDTKLNEEYANLSKKDKNLNKIQFLLNPQMNKIIYKLNRLKEGSRYTIWEIIEAPDNEKMVCNRKFVMKTFNVNDIKIEDRNKFIEEIEIAYHHLIERDDIRVPQFLNFTTFKSDGYFIWEYIRGTKPQFADVKEVLKSMVVDPTTYIKDFKPGNVIKSNGCVYVVDPAFNKNESKPEDLEKEIFATLKQWICPYQVGRISIKEYIEFIREIPQMPKNQQESWQRIQNKLDEVFLC